MLLWTWGCIYLFEVVFVFPLDKDPKMELSDDVIVLFFIVTAPIYSPTNTIWGFPFLHILVFVFLYLSGTYYYISGKFLSNRSMHDHKKCKAAQFLECEFRVLHLPHFILLAFGHCLVTFSEYISKCLGFIHEITKLTLYEWDNFKYCFLTFTIFPPSCIPTEGIAYNCTHNQNYL